MNHSTYSFTLDIQSDLSQVSLPIRFGDTNRKLYITLTDGGNPYILQQGFTAALCGKKADNTHLFNHCIIENQTTVRYDFTEQTANCNGIVDCEIRVYDPEGRVVTSPRFVMVVNERVVYDSDIPFSEDERTMLDDIIATERKRVSAEIERDTEEKARAAAEIERDTEEKARTAAENERKQTFGDLVNLFNDLVVRAGAIRATEVTLRAASWVGTESPYSQVVAVEGATEYSKVDLLPSAEQLAEFQEKDLALVTENEDGVITVFAIGTKPTQDWTIQATITEVIL